MTNFGAYTPGQVQYIDPFANAMRATAGARDTLLKLRGREQARQNALGDSIQNYQDIAKQADARKVDATQRDILTNTVKNPEGLDSYGGLDKFNDPYSKASSEYEKALALLPNKGVTKERNPDGSIKLAPEREALDQQYQGYIEELNKDTVSAFETAQNTVTDPTDYADRAFKEQIAKGVPLEQATKLRDQILADSTPTLTEAEIKERDLASKALTEQYKAEQEMIRKGGVSFTKGTGNAPGSASTKYKKDANKRGIYEPATSSDLVATLKGEDMEKNNFIGYGGGIDDFAALDTKLKQQFPEEYNTGMLRDVVVGKVSDGFIFDNTADVGQAEKDTIALMRAARAAKAKGIDVTGGGQKAWTQQTGIGNYEDIAAASKASTDRYNNSMRDLLARAPSAKERLLATDPLAGTKRDLFFNSGKPTKALNSKESSDKNASPVSTSSASARKGLGGPEVVTVKTDVGNLPVNQDTVSVVREYLGTETPESEKGILSWIKGNSLVYKRLLQDKAERIVEPRGLGPLRQDESGSKFGPTLRESLLPTK